MSVILPLLPLVFVLILVVGIAWLRRRRPRPLRTLHEGYFERHLREGAERKWPTVASWRVDWNVKTGRWDWTPWRVLTSAEAARAAAELVTMDDQSACWERVDL